MKKKIIKKATIILIIILMIFSVFMVVKGMPMIAVSKIETALNNKNGKEFSELYDKYSINDSTTLLYDWLQTYTFDSITNYISEWITPIENDFNIRFSNYESQEEMESFLKNEYGTLFIDENNSYTNEEAFEILYSLLKSKICFVNFYNDYKTYLTMSSLSFDDPAEDLMSEIETSMFYIEKIIPPLSYSYIKVRDSYYSEFQEIKEQIELIEKNN